MLLNPNYFAITMSSLFIHQQLFTEQSIDDMKRYFQGGSVAAYQHVAMLKLHYKITHALEDSLASLEFDESPEPPRRRRSQLLFKQRSLKTISRSPPSGGVHFDKLVSSNDQLQQGGSESTSSSSDGYMSDDEHERGGFDGVDYGRRPSVKSSLDNKI